MREFQERNRYKRILFSKVGITIILFLLAFFAHATWGVYQKERESAANTLRAEQQLKKLEDRERVLTHEIERLNTPRGIEEDIRSKYSVAKPGENILIIVDDKDTQTEQQVIEKTWWQRFKEFLK